MNEYNVLQEVRQLVIAETTKSKARRRYTTTYEMHTTMSHNEFSRLLFTSIYIYSIKIFLNLTTSYSHRSVRRKSLQEFTTPHTLDGLMVL
jgi:hypothetical protein